MPWAVRRLVCDYGQLHISGYGPSGLDIHSKFCFDFKNFSPATAPAESHELVLWDAVAATTPIRLFCALTSPAQNLISTVLFKKRSLTGLTLEGGLLVFGKSLREIFQRPELKPVRATPPLRECVDSRTLDIRRIAVRLDDERPQISDITFALNTSLKNIPLSKSASASGSEPQTIEIANLEILSPLDPFTKVLTLDSIFLRFTLAGLLRREIDQLTILGPNIFLGEDLFWYMDDMQKRLGGDGREDAGPGWTNQEA